MSRYLRGKFALSNPDKYVGNHTPTYRSSWEWTFMHFCDKDPRILKWASEAVKIPYKDPFTGEKLIKIIDETNITPASIFNSKFDDVVNRIQTKFKSFDFIIKSGFIFLTLITIQLLLHKDRKRIKDLFIYSGFGFIIFAILGIYISIYLRLPERVFFPFMTLLPFLFIFYYILIFYRNNEIKSNKLISTIFDFILLFDVAFDYKEYFNKAFGHAPNVVDKVTVN